MVRDFRRANTATPVVLMGYANPIEAMGATGVRGPREGVRRRWRPGRRLPAGGGARSSRSCSPRATSRPIFLLSPTTTEARIAAVAKVARGYVYYVSLKGVTGAGHIDAADVASKLAQIRKQVTLPVGVGFGIRDAASAQAIAAHADAVVIGSRIIEEIEAGPPAAAAARAGAWLKGIRQALDAMADKRAALSRAAVAVHLAKKFRGAPR